MSTETFTVEMKATIGLIIAFLILLVVGSIGSLLTGPFDIYILLSLIFIISYVVFVAFCWKRKSWAYMGSMILAVFLVFATPVAISGDQQMPPLLMWETVMATVLNMLIALESFKAYSEMRQSLRA